MNENDILDKLNIFIKKAVSISKKGKSDIVLPMMYELFEKVLVDNNKNKMQDIFDTLIRSSDELNVQSKINVSAESAKKKTIYKNVEEEIYTLYCECWKKFGDDIYFEETKKILNKKFIRNNIDPKKFKGLRALDMGCGSGRYTIALKSLGFKEVVGVDLGADGIKFARQKLKRRNIKGVTFQIASVLDLPFSEGEFDFVFCNGVLHHTVNTDKGLKEIYRVLKKDGNAWVYVYNSDGLFWTIRKAIRKVLKYVPREESFYILRKMGLPSNKVFMFMDAGYVAIENNYLKSEFKEKLKASGFKRIKFLHRGADHDLSEAVYLKKTESKILYGKNGDLRFLVSK